MKIKICGNRCPENLEAISALRPDLVGFIFHPGSPRYVGLEFEPSVMRDLPPSVGTVGVFVDEPLSDLFEHQKRFHFRYIQLHGDESPAYCKEVFTRGWDIIKAFSIDPGFAFDELAPYEPYCDYFLFDTPATDRGGSGTPFPWERLKQYTLDTPFFLAGGLGLDNVTKALSLNHPRLAGLDLNSQLEDEPGIKNILKAGTIIETIRTYGTA